MLLLSITPRSPCMRIRLLSILALSSLLTLPAFASSVAPNGSHRGHHRSAHLRRAGFSSCSRVAGHASHTVLSAPSAAPCHAAAAHLVRAAVVSRPEIAEQSTPLVRRTAALNRVRWVPPLRGSLASLERQNERDTAEGLVRIEDDAQLDQMEADGQIVPVPASAALRVNPDLPVNRRYCRPWAARFLADLAASHYARFHRTLQVNSAVRTVAFQRELLMVNGNAAPADGDIASPHLTGAAVDIGKRGLSFQEIAWMRAWLLPLETAGKIDVEEEFYQSCFHITVYRSYEPPPQPRVVPHRRRGATTTLLAAGVR